MNKEKGLVVILSHADTPDKIELLIECVSSIKKQEYDILISSHIEISKEVNDMVDYVVYDKENPLIMYDEYTNTPSIVYVWMSLTGYEQSYPIKFNHAYAVLKLIQNGSSIADMNGYRNVHFLNYDYVLNDKNILIKHNEILNNYDIVSYDWTNYGANHNNNISSGFFSVNNNNFISLIKNIKSKEDYCNYGSPVFEEFLYNYVNNNSTLKTFNLSVSELFDNLPPEEVGKSKTNKIAVKSILDDHIINNKIYLFLTKDSYENYYVFIRYDKILYANFVIGDMEYNWSSNPGVNLLPVTLEQIKDGIFINIKTDNEDNINISRLFNSKTVTSNCVITENSYIQDIFKGSSIVNKKYTIEKYCDDNAPKRFDLINFLIKEYGFKDYLEIGVNDGSCIRKINIENKDGVDPSPNSEIGFGDPVPEINYQITSDEFFNNYSYKKYDIIFIDGLHHSDQVDKDIQNSLKYLNDGGFILLHDCNPPEEFLQIVPRQSGLWNGDVWKSIVKLRCNDPSLEINVVDVDWGVGVIRRGNSELYTKNNLNECLEYNYLNSNREELLNIISIDEFFNKFKKETDVVIVITHADTDEKIKVLNKCIKEIKNQGFKIIISSHIDIPDYILNDVDYFVYDKENLIVDLGNNSTKFILNLNGYSQEYKFRNNYSYSILKLMKNAISLSNSNGFKISHIVNYDYIITDKELLNKHSQILNEKDVIFYQQDKIEGTICPGIFSIKNNKFLELFDEINNQDVYFSYGITQFENFLHYNFTKLNYKQENLNLIRDKVLIDLISLNEKIVVEKNIDGFIQKTMVFISSENSNYYLVIITNIDIQVKLSIDDIIFSPDKNNVNIIKIDYTDLINGFSLEIPTIDFHNTYNINTNIADCIIHDNSLIKTKEDLFVFSNN